MLNDGRVIEMLNGRFANAWVLARDLPRLAAETDDPDLRRLYETLHEHYTYPVDSIVVGLDGEVLAEVEVTTSARGGPVSYLEFLRASLAASE